MILTLHNITKSYGDHTVLSGIHAKVEDRDRIGLIGVNGAGKSTLLNIIAGALSPDGGEVIFGKEVTLGYLRQNTPLTSGATISEEMNTVFADLLVMEAELTKCQTELASAEGQEYKRLSAKLSSLTKAFEAADGYNVDVKIATVLSGLGFPKNTWEKQVDCLSGGERVRLSLAKLLLSEPSVLMLDEPTNHLDFETLSFLEDYIKSYKGAVLMVSHDRFFLDETVSQIWEVEQPELICYKGNYSKYKILRQERQEFLEKEYQKDLERRAQLSDYVARNLVRASTSAMAKSRRKQLDRMEEVKAPSPMYQGMSFSFQPEHKSGFDVLTAEQLSARVGDRTLFEHMDLTVKRGEKIALVGKNGIGKTTLLRMLLQSESEREGTVRWGKNASVGYFDQHGENLDGSLTALEQIRTDFPADTDGEIRSLLARVMLRGEMPFSLVGSLSGGQKAGLNFARLMRRKDNVLVLDEPTNHLDLASREALEKALSEFEGTVIMVSHDRYMLKTVPTAIYRLSETGLEKFSDLETMRSAKSEPKAPSVTKAPSAYKNKEERARQAKRRSRLSALEKEIAALETENARLEQQLAENSSDYQQVEQLCDRLAQNKEKISVLTDEWLLLEEDAQ